MKLFSSASIATKKLPLLEEHLDLVYHSLLLPEELKNGKVVQMVEKEK